MLQILKLALSLFKRVAAKIWKITTVSKKWLFLAIVFAIIRRIKNAPASVSYYDPSEAFLNSAIGF